MELHGAVLSVCAAPILALEVLAEGGFARTVGDLGRIWRCFYSSSFASCPVPV